MDNEETIKRIQELVPSVMELEEGCRVRICHAIISLSDDKIKSLKDKYGRCFMESDFFEGDDENEPYIKIPLADTVSKVEEYINSDSSPFTVNEIDPIFNTFGVNSTKSYGEITCIGKKQSIYDCRIALKDKHKPIGEIILRVEKVLLEILGKPITLAVVLMAVEKFTGSSDDVLYVNSVGLMYIINSNKTQKDFIKQFENCVEWNLSQDNFNDQSEETKTFIGKLLVNKEL